LTQRPLTAAEQELARAAYNAIGKLYMPTAAASELVRACCHISEMLQHNTTDGKPLRTERAPTKDDIGKRVKVRPSGVSPHWMTGFVLVGFRDDFFVVHDPSGGYFSFFNCIIDEEAAQ